MYPVKQAHTAAQLNAIYELRYKVLRQPWNQPLDTSSDELDPVSVNAFIEDGQGTVIACGRLQENNGLVGQVRYMAVDPSYQGKGLGKALLLFLENKAMQMGLIKIQLHARELAVDFYKNSGYTMVGKSHLLWGIIPHYLMEKPVPLAH